MSLQDKVIKEEIIYIETLVKQLKRGYNQDSHYGTINNLCPEIAKSCARLKKLTKWRDYEVQLNKTAYRNGQDVPKLK